MEVDHISTLHMSQQFTQLTIIIFMTISLLKELAILLSANEMYIQFIFFISKKKRSYLMSYPSLNKILRKCQVNQQEYFHKLKCMHACTFFLSDYWIKKSQNIILFLLMMLIHSIFRRFIPLYFLKLSLLVSTYTIVLNKSQIIEHMLLYIIALLVLLLSYLAYKWIILPMKIINNYERLFKLKGYKTIKMPYRPYSAPLFAQVIQDQQKLKDPMFRHKRQYTQVEVIFTNILTNPSIALMNAELIKEMNSPQKFIVFQKERKLFQVVFSIINKGMLTSQGTDWKHKRKLISTIFNYDFIKTHIPMMINIADQVFDDFENSYWEKHPQQKKKGSYKVEIVDIITKFTSSIVISGFLGMNSLKDKLKDEPVSNEILRLTNMAVELSNDPLVLIFGQNLINKRWRKIDRQFVSFRSEIRNILKSYITKEEQELQLKSEENQTQKSIIKLMLQERKKGEQSFEITSDYLIDQIKTFVIAGTDTTTTFITAMLLLVFQKPSVASRLKQQIDSIIKSDADINVNNFKKLKYLDCVINQTSRMICSVVAPFTRRLAQDTTLGGIPIKKGTMIDCIWMNMMYNPENFEEPMEFKPERWQKEESSKNHNLISMIFSGGPRGCLGKNLALTEMRVMMIKFMQRYKNLVELSLKKRAYELGITYSIQNTECILTKKK